MDPLAVGVRNPSPALTGLLTIALLLAPTARAWDDGYAPSLRGYVKGFAFQQAVDPWELERAGARLQLSLSGGQGEPATYYAALDFELDSALFTGASLDERAAAFDVYPVEIYLNLTLGDVELKVGKQFVFWGRAAWVNPTDVISAWDYAHIASEIEDYRVAPLAVRANWYLFESLMLDLVYVPLFTPHRIPMVVPTTMGGLPVREQEPILPGREPWNGEFGMRLNHSISSRAFDWSISGYLGHDKAPQIEIAPIMEELPGGPPGAPPIVVPAAFSWTDRYPRLWQVGADFAVATGAFVIKGESALKRFLDLDDEGIGLPPRRLETVIGVDYSYSEDLDAGLQYVSRYLIGWDRDGEIERLEALHGGTPPFVEEELTHEASLRLNFKLPADLGGQLIALYNFSYQDFMLLGFLSWEMADALKLYVGGIGFGGADEYTPFGRQTDFSRIFVELKYSF